MSKSLIKSTGSWPNTWMLEAGQTRWWHVAASKRCSGTCKQSRICLTQACQEHNLLDHINLLPSKEKGGIPGERNVLGEINNKADQSSERESVCKESYLCHSSDPKKKGKRLLFLCLEGVGRTHLRLTVQGRKLFWFQQRSNALFWWHRFELRREPERLLRWSQTSTVTNR